MADFVIKQDADGKEIRLMSAEFARGVLKMMDFVLQMMDFVFKMNGLCTRIRAALISGDQPGLRLLNMACVYFIHK